MKIGVIGLGYVGLANAILLAQHNEVLAFDISNEKIELINKRISPIQDLEIEYYLQNEKINLNCVTKIEDAVKETSYVIIATPTNYDTQRESFDTSSVEAVIEEILKYNSDVTIVIKSTIPLGYTERIKKHYLIENIIFSPEFLREGKALYDNLYPSRIIVGEKSKRAEVFAKLLIQGAKQKDIPVLFTQPTEAEAIKLFANTYLAMRVSFFNELDTYAETQGLSSENIIKGVCADSRIGDYYNNPSFGYGGYCLPKDTKQLLMNYVDIPNEIIRAVVKSNETRKNFIVSQIIKKNPKTVGVYHLAMKHGADNYRESPVLDIINELLKNEINVIIYEECNIKEGLLKGLQEKDFSRFKESSDIIIANRYEKALEDVKKKVYTRDIWKRD